MNYDNVLHRVNTNRKDSLSFKDLIHNISSYALITNNENILNTICSLANNEPSIFNKNYTDYYLPNDRLILKILNGGNIYFEGVLSIDNFIKENLYMLENNHIKMEQKIDLTKPFKFFFIFKKDISPILKLLYSKTKSNSYINLNEKIIILNNTCNSRSNYNKIINKYSEYFKEVPSIMYLPLPYEKKNTKIFVIQDFDV